MKRRVIEAWEEEMQRGKQALKKCSFTGKLRCFLDIKFSHVRTLVFEVPPKCWRILLKCCVYRFLYVTLFLL
jgi:hypothetical protein